MQNEVNDERRLMPSNRRVATSGESWFAGNPRLLRVLSRIRRGVRPKRCSAKSSKVTIGRDSLRRAQQLGADSRGIAKPTKKDIGRGSEENHESPKI